MAGINLFTNNSYNSQSSLFDSLQKSTSTFSLGEYGLIKSGAYKKLVKSYYSDSSSKGSGILSSEQKKANKIEAQNYMNIKSEANSLKESLADITSKADELFVTKQVDGKTEFDSDNALKAVKKFVEDYNSLIDSVSDSDNTSILRNGVWMTGEVSAYSKVLSEVGISVGSDNKLSIDETDFKTADVNSLKTLFSNSSYSFAGSITSKASTIASQSNLNALKLTRTGGVIYTKNASFMSTGTGSIFDSML